MSQRNPMNERYQNDDRQGKTRRSAASAKPATKAAASVRIQSAQKTKEQKKTEQKQRRAKQAEIEREFYNPPTPEYKFYRRIWWALLIFGIIAVCVSFFAQNNIPDQLSFALLIIAYVAVGGAIVLDFSKIRKIRAAYAEEMRGKKSKELRAKEKELKAQARKAQTEKETRLQGPECSETAIGGFPVLRENLKKLGFGKKNKNETSGQN